MYLYFSICKTCSYLLNRYYSSFVPFLLHFAVVFFSICLAQTHGSVVNNNGDPFRFWLFFVVVVVRDYVLFLFDLKKMHT